MFKIKHESQHHFVLQHPDGHEVKIAKHALSKKTLEKFQGMPQAEGFADGGEVRQPQGVSASFDEAPPPDPTADMQSPTVFDPMQPFNMVKEYVAAPIARAGEKIVEGGKAALKAPFQKANPNFKPVSLQSGVGQEPEPMNASQWAPGTTEGKPTPAVDYDPTQGQASSLKMVKQATSQQGKALQQEATALGAKGELESKIYQQQADFNQHLMDTTQKELGNLDKEHETILKDYMSGHIDPKRLWNDSSIGAKVGTAIGLILGGIGGGLAGTENQALKFLNMQVDRDIEAQKANLGKKKTLLEENLRRTGDLKSAAELTRLQYGSIIQAQLGKAAADSASPIAKAEAAKKSADINAAMVPLKASLSQQMAINKILANPALKQEEYASHAIRLGVLSGRIPKELQDNAYKELTGLQNAKAVGDTALKAWGDIDKMVLAGTFNPNDRHSAMEAVVAQLSKDTAGRYTPQDAEAIGTLFPSKFDTDAVRQKKKKRLLQFVSEKAHSSLLEGFGIPIPKIKMPANSLNSGPGFQNASMKR